jgi:hypothetical protein
MSSALLDDKQNADRPTAAEVCLQTRVPGKKRDYNKDYKQNADRPR